MASHEVSREVRDLLDKQVQDIRDTDRKATQWADAIEARVKSRSGANQ